MAKILYVKAWGLWSHYESVFDFSPGLTVITGPNGSGKSTLIRIVKWVAQGDPSGENFIFKVEDEKGNILRQAEEGKAEIGLDNGVVITKTRKKGKTTYIINTISEPFEKAEVPQEVKDALGINKYNFGDFEAYLNYAFQLEAPFLLSESPSTGAKVLGKLAGTETVDLAIREIAKRTHKARDEKRLADKEIERINGDLLDYMDLDDIKEQVKACEYLVSEIETAVGRKENLNYIKNNYFTAVETVETLEAELLRYMIVPELEEDLKSIENTQRRYDTLLDIYGQLNQSTQDIEVLKSQLTCYDGVETAAFMFAEVEGTSQRLADISNLSTLYTSYTQDIQTAEDCLVTLEGIDVAAADLEYVSKSVIKMDNLKTLRGEFVTAHNQIDRYTADIDELKGIETAVSELGITLEKAVRLETLRFLSREYDLKAATASQEGQELLRATITYEEANVELQAAWEASGGTCPLCDQPINEHSQVWRATH